MPLRQSKRRRIDSSTNSSPDVYVPSSSDLRPLTVNNTLFYVCQRTDIVFYCHGNDSEGASELEPVGKWNKKRTDIDYYSDDASDKGENDDVDSLISNGEVEDATVPRRCLLSSRLLHSHSFHDVIGGAVLHIADAVSDESIVAVQEEILELDTKGYLKPTSQHNDSVRTDRVCYLRVSDGGGITSECRAGDAVRKAMKMVEGLGYEYNKYLKRHCHPTSQTSPCRRVLMPAVCMVSIYDGGAKYVPHRDSEARGETFVNPRYLTCIVYFNDKSWKIDDGGMLRAHPQGAAVVEVLPRGVVMFESRQLVHEVTPANRRRFAITVWFVVDDKS